MGCEHDRPTNGCSDCWRGLLEDYEYKKTYIKAFKHILERLDWEHKEHDSRPLADSPTAVKCNGCQLRTFIRDLLKG